MLKDEREAIESIDDLEYYEEGVNGIDLVKINQKNIYFIEKMIKYNSIYQKMNDEMYKDADRLLKSGEKLGEELLRNICIDIDNTNSTHINQDNKGRLILPKRISEFNDLKEALLNNEYPLIYSLYQPITEDEFNKKLDKNTKRQIINKKRKDGKNVSFTKNVRNISFATKFCHYMTIKLTENFNEEQQDKYSIYDSYLRKAIPLYMEHFKDKEYFKNYPTYFKDILKKHKKYYEIDLSKGKDEKIVDRYKKYQEIIGKIIEYAKEEEGEDFTASRNGFDHLLWYYYKGKI